MKDFRRIRSSFYRKSKQQVKPSSKPSRINVVGQSPAKVRLITLSDRSSSWAGVELPSLRVMKYFPPLPAFHIAVGDRNYDPYQAICFSRDRVRFPKLRPRNPNPAVHAKLFG